jgi:biopolymer transport protein ExbD
LMGVMEILRAGGYSKIKLVALEGAPAAAATGPTTETAKP